MFDYKFPEAARAEGLTLCEGIGLDMVPLAGYLGYEVIQDVTDPGHLMVNTHWVSQEAANAVLSVYQHNAKITRATQLLGGTPSPGFVGAIKVQA